MPCCLQALRSQPDTVPLQATLPGAPRSDKEVEDTPLLPRVERYDAAREQQVQNAMHALVAGGAGKGQRATKGVKAEGGGTSGGGGRAKRET